MEIAEQFEGEDKVKGSLSGETIETDDVIPVQCGMAIAAYAPTLDGRLDVPACCFERGLAGVYPDDLVPLLSKGDEEAANATGRVEDPHGLRR